MTPQWTEENGVTVATERRDDGTIGFTITRFLDKAPTYGTQNDPELKVSRIASLEVDGLVTPSLKTTVAGEEQKTTLVYWFALAPASIASTHFSLSEFAEYKDPTKLSLPLGGTQYEFNLSEFAAALTAQNHP